MTRPLVLLIVIALLAAACSSADDQTVNAASQAQEPSESDSEGAMVNPDELVVDPTNPGFCSEEAVELLSTEVRDGDQSTVADELQGPEIWAEMTTSPEVRGAFTDIEIFSEVEFEEPLSSFFAERPGEAELGLLSEPRLVDVGEAVGDLGEASPGAPLFATPSTADRLAEINLDSAESLLLGLVWNDEVEAWGIRTAWLSSAVGDVAAIGDCEAIYTTQLAEVRNEVFPQNDLRTVLLAAPYRTVDEFFYGAPDGYQPFDLESVDSLNDGDFEVSVSIFDPGDEDRLICFSQTTDSLCVRTLAASGEPFEVSFFVNPGADIEVALVDDESELPAAETDRFNPEVSSSLEIAVEDDGGLTLTSTG